MKTAVVVSFVVLYLSLYGTSEGQRLPSGVYDWTKIPVEKTSTGEKRSFLDASTSIFESFNVHVTSLEPGVAPHDSHIHTDWEELILVKEGKVAVTIGGETSLLGPGSIAFAEVGAEHRVSNAGDTKASYYIIRWKVRSPMNNLGDIGNRLSEVFDYEKMNYTATQKGSRRSILQRPTLALQELEMHITTLNEGVTSHGQHVHGDEEIIMVLKGEVEEIIKDRPHRLGPGSLIYLAADDPHGIRNAGTGSCEYYAIRWIGRK